MMPHLLGVEALSGSYRCQQRVPFRYLWPIAGSTALRDARRIKERWNVCRGYLHVVGSSVLELQSLLLACNRRNYSQVCAK